MKINRRGFSLGSSSLIITLLLGGRVVNLTPAEARAQDIPFRNLSRNQADLIDFLGDAIVPGAKISGLSHYIDHQLFTGSRNNLLILHYLGVMPPFDDFYISSLKAFERAAMEKYDKTASALTPDEITEFITEMMQGNPDGWEASGEAAPAAPFFYFVLRSDAIDVTYGTMAAFDNLEIPYMAHIEPAHPWKVKP